MAGSMIFLGGPGAAKHRFDLHARLDAALDVLGALQQPPRLVAPDVEGSAVGDRERLAKECRARVRSIVAAFGLDASFDSEIHAELKTYRAAVAALFVGALSETSSTRAPCAPLSRRSSPASTGRCSMSAEVLAALCRLCDGAGYLPDGGCPTTANTPRKVGLPGVEPCPECGRDGCGPGVRWTDAGRTLLAAMGEVISLVERMQRAGEEAEIDVL